MPSVQRRRSAGPWRLERGRAACGRATGSVLVRGRIRVCGLYMWTQVTASTSMCYTVTRARVSCAQTKDPPEIQPDRGRESATPSWETIHGPRHARRRATKTRSPGEARTPARDISATRECTPPRRTSGSAAATARTLRGIERVAVRRDETTFTCFTNGNLSGFVTCMPVAPTSPAGALREIWPRSHLWLARLGLSRWACSCRCAWPTRGCLRP